MKKVFLSLIALGMFSVARAQQLTPEEKAALKAAQKEAKTEMNAGIKLRDQVLMLNTAIQEEQAKGEKADQEEIKANQAQIKEKSLEAIDHLQKAMRSGMIADKKMFEPSKALDDVATFALNPELNLAADNQPFDTLAYAKAVDAVCEGCYGVIAYGNKKDELQKMPILQSEVKMPKLMTYYAYLTLWYTQDKNVKGAEQAFEKYKNFGKDYPLVAENEAVKKPQYPFSQFAFNLYYTAYELKDAELAEKYYREALEYPDAGSHSFVIASRPQMYKDMGDTVKWVGALEDLVTEFGDEEVGENALQNLLAIYSHQGNEVMAKKVNEILAKNPDSKVANYGKGYSLFAAEKFVEAKQYYEKAISIDPTYANAWYMAGMCEYRAGMDNYYKYIDSKKYTSVTAMKEAEEKYVRTHFRAALPYFEKLREMKPEAVDDWASPLQNIYKNLGEADKAKEMEQLLN